MFRESFIQGVFEYNLHVFSDDRGEITKIFHRPTFEEMGISCTYGETILSKNRYAGVIRGFHFQYPPYVQSKLLFCLSGNCCNFLLDLRQGSPTYGQVDKVELDCNHAKALIIPTGVANAFVINEDNTTILYHLTSKYMPEYEGGICWNSVGVDFGVKNPIISEKDYKLPQFKDFVSPFTWKA